MNISIICSSKDHPIYPLLKRWEKKYTSHVINIVNSVSELEGGDLLFLISCNEIVTKDVRELYKKSLVIHASDLPNGRGWSPHIWRILEGEKNITVTLLEAEDNVDSGDIWSQTQFDLEGHELYDEINALLFDAELSLMDYAVEEWGKVVPISQSREEPSYYPKRTPEDSEIDPSKSISEQFDLIRVADPNRFPSFFYHQGKRYILKVEKY